MTDGNFEAKLCAIRKNKDGLVVSLVVHPHDAGRDLMTLDIGARVMIGWAECTDAPDATRAASAPPHTNTQTSPVPPEPEPPRETAKKRTPFAQLPLSQQAGLLCKDDTFRAWLTAREGIHHSSSLAEIFVRQHCGIGSRAQLDERQNGAAREKWRALYDEFAAWKLTQAYAETLR
jgi:hypothetical protein